MTRSFAFAAVAAAAIAAVSPVFAANDQLIAAAGLTPEQAQGLTLNQIAAAKYNRGRSFTDRQAVIIDRSGDALELETLAVEIYNRGRSVQDVQVAPTASSVTMASRGGAQDRALEAFAVEIYNSGKSFNDRQPTAN